jgi:hypothetical protein
LVRLGLTSADEIEQRATNAWRLMSASRQCCN